MNELVRLNTQDVGKAIPITNTMIIAAKYQVSHISVIKLVEKYVEDFEDFGKLVSFQMTLDNSQRSSKVYSLNEEQFYLLVTYMKNTEIARKYKKEFIKAFSFAKKELQARVQTRHIGIAARKELGSVIKNCVTDEGNFKSFAYSNYTRLVYKKILGKDVKKAKEELGLTKNDNLRDYLTIEQLEQAQDLESKIATYIEFTDTTGKTDKEIFQEIKRVLDN